MDMDTNYTVSEVAAITAVGAGLTWGSTKLTKMRLTPLLLLSGAGLYTLGVFVGSMRPEEGWLPAEEEPVSVPLEETELEAPRTQSGGMARPNPMGLTLGPVGALVASGAVLYALYYFAGDKL